MIPGKGNETKVKKKNKGKEWYKKKVREGKLIKGRDNCR